MENPYARSAGSSAAPATASAPLAADAQRLSDYEAAVGPNREYYLPKFEQYDEAGTSASWHWPAFFVTSPWFIYRKMWLPGILNIAYPWLLTLVMAIVAAAAKLPPVVTGGLYLLLLAAPSFVLAAYANPMYYRHVRKLIDRLPGSVAALPDKRQLRLERQGGTGVGAMIGILAGGFFVALFFIGIIAAISIPAYQDYTIRSQVTEGLNLASGVKAEVAEFYSENHRWPDQADLPSDAPTGKHVSAIRVRGGSVIIVFGNEANKLIQNQGLALTPALDTNDEIRWICGNGKAQLGERVAEGPHGSDLPEKYLPRMCRTAGS
jgi:type IV pilus assembly protein PilA